MEIEDNIKDNEVKLDDLKDPSDEKFLFFFKPEKIDKECVGGLSLKTGVIILSVIVFYEALYSLVNIFEASTTSKYIINLLLLILYLCIGSLALLSIYNNNLSFAKYAYILASVIFIFEAFIYLIKSAVKLFEFINPFDGDFFKLKKIIDVIGYLAYLFIFLYFIYVLFCFMFELKRNS